MLFECSKELNDQLIPPEEGSVAFKDWQMISVLSLRKCHLNEVKWISLW
jgi:hypothetical protein